MDVTTILLLLLVGSIATFFAGDKLASKVALLFSLGALGLSLYLLNLLNQGTDISFVGEWIANPKVALAFKADGLSMAMVLLTTALTPLIVFSSESLKNLETVRSKMLLIDFCRDIVLSA